MKVHIRFTEGNRDRALQLSLHFDDVTVEKVSGFGQTGSTAQIAESQLAFLVDDNQITVIKSVY